MNFNTIPKNEIALKEAIEYLKHYGYFSDIFAHVKELTVVDVYKMIKSKKERDKSFREAIARFQEFFDIKKDGDFGPETMRAMSRPRCGCPDIIPSGAAGAGQCKWPHLDVTYAFELSLSGVTDEQTTKAFIDACELWNAVCGLRLKRIESLGSANIWARSRRIDGRGGTLAWSYLPCGASSRTQLEQRYDTGENWSTRFLTEVICHEVGHAIGLNHHNGNSIMHPTATGQWPVPQAVDIRSVVSRYGEPEPTPEPPEPEPPTPEPPQEGWPEIQGTISIDGKPHRIVPDVNLGAL